MRSTRSISTRSIPTPTTISGSPRTRSSPTTGRLTRTRVGHYSPMPAIGRDLVGEPLCSKSRNDTTGVARLHRCASGGDHRSKEACLLVGRVASCAAFASARAERPQRPGDFWQRAARGKHPKAEGGRVLCRRRELPSVPGGYYHRSIPHCHTDDRVVAHLESFLTRRRVEEQHPQNVLVDERRSWSEALARHCD